MKKQQTDYQRSLKKYIKDDASLTERMHKNYAHYRKISQIAVYADLSNVQKKRIITKSTPDSQSNINFTYYAERVQENIVESTQYLLVKMLDEQIPKIKNQFNLIYIHNAFSDFVTFKSILQQMPQHFFYKMKAIFIVGGGMIVQVYNIISIGHINKFLDKFFVYADDIHELQQAKKIKISDQRFKSGLKNIQTSNSQMSSQTKKAQISKPSEVKIVRNQLYGKPLQEYSLGRHGIPLVIELLLHRFMQNSDFERTEGIMRKSCDVQQLQILENHIIAKNISYLKQVKDPYVIIGCVKKIFNNLDIPLFNYSIYDLVINMRAQNKEEQISLMRNLISKMDALHRKTFLFMIAFFLQRITINEQYNKMSPYNIAVVFGPCFFRPKEYRIEDLMNSGKCSKIVLNFLNSFQQIIGHEQKVQYFMMVDKVAS